LPAASGGAFWSDETERDIEASFTFPSRHQKAARPSEQNEPSFNGQPDDSIRPSFATGAVSALDEISKPQRLLLLIGFHQMKIKRTNGSPLLGISPMRDSLSPAQDRAGVVDGQLDSGPEIEAITSVNHEWGITLRGYLSRPAVRTQY
jgi:hypothetical protein